MYTSSIPKTWSFLCARRDAVLATAFSWVCGICRGYRCLLRAIIFIRTSGEWRGDRLRVSTSVSSGSLMVVIKSLPLCLKYDSLLEMPCKNINEAKRRGGKTGQKEKLCWCPVGHHVGNLGVHYSYTSLIWGEETGSLECCANHHWI